MDINSISKLLSSIAANYPSFKKEISNGEGNIAKYVIDEWSRRIGFMTYEEADKILADYLVSDQAKFAPKITDFLTAGATPKVKKNYFVDMAPRRYKIKANGLEIEDEEGHEFSNPYNEPYYYKNDHIFRHDPKLGEVLVY